MSRRRARPVGQATRGKTAPNRLRKTDTFLTLAYPELVRHMPGMYVDLGYGAYPITSVETLHRLRGHCDRLLDSYVVDQVLRPPATAIATR